MNVAAAPRAMPASTPVAPSGAPQQQGVSPSTPPPHQQQQIPTAPSPATVPPSGGGMAVATTVPLGVPSPATGVPMAMGQGFSPASVGVTLGSLPPTTAGTAPSVGTSTLSHVPSGLGPMAAPLSVASTGVPIGSQVNLSTPIDPAAAAAAAAVAAAAAAVGTPPMRSGDSVQVRTIPRLPYDVHCYVARLCVLALPHCCSNGAPN